MSLNKFTSASKGQELKLEIGCQHVTASGNITCTVVTTESLQSSGPGSCMNDLCVDGPLEIQCDDAALLKLNPPNVGSLGEFLSSKGDGTVEFKAVDVSAVQNITASPGVTNISGTTNTDVLTFKNADNSVTTLRPSDYGEAAQVLHTDGVGGTYWAPDAGTSGAIVYGGPITTIGKHYKINSADGLATVPSAISESATELNIGALIVKNIGAAVDPTDAISKNQVDMLLSNKVAYTGPVTTVGTHMKFNSTNGSTVVPSVINEGALTIDMGGLQIKNIAQADDPTDALTKQQFSTSVDPLIAKTVNQSYTVMTDTTAFTGLLAGDRLKTGEAVEIVNQMAAPSNPDAGSCKIYTKADDKLYILNSASVETVVGAASSLQTAYNTGSSVSVTVSNPITLNAVDDAKYEDVLIINDSGDQLQHKFTKDGRAFHFNRTITPQLSVNDIARYNEAQPTTIEGFSIDGTAVDSTGDVIQLKVANSGKLLIGSSEIVSEVVNNWKHQTTPVAMPGLNYSQVYVKSDDKLYTRNNAGTETLIGPSSAVVSLQGAYDGGPHINVTAGNPIVIQAVDDGKNEDLFTAYDSSASVIYNFTKAGTIFTNSVVCNNIQGKTAEVTIEQLKIDNSVINTDSDLTFQHTGVTKQYFTPSSTVLNNTSTLIQSGGVNKINISSINTILDNTNETRIQRAGVDRLAITSATTTIDATTINSTATTRTMNNGVIAPSNNPVSAQTSNSSPRQVYFSTEIATVNSAFRAFDKLDATSWRSATFTYDAANGSYVGAVSSFGELGEYIGIFLSSAIYLNKIQIRSEPGTQPWEQERAVRGFSILGSNDNVTYTLIERGTLPRVTIGGTLLTYTMIRRPTVAYQYYRFVVRSTHAQGGGYTNTGLSELIFVGGVTLPTTITYNGYSVADPVYGQRKRTNFDNLLANFQVPTGTGWSDLDMDGGTNRGFIYSTIGKDIDFTNSVTTTFLKAGMYNITMTFNVVPDADTNYNVRCLKNSSEVIAQLFLDKIGNRGTETSMDFFSEMDVNDTVKFQFGQAGAALWLKDRYINITFERVF